MTSLFTAGLGRRIKLCLTWGELLEEAAKASLCLGDSVYINHGA